MIKNESAKKDMVWFLIGTILGTILYNSGLI
jgi:hypothetical protein